MFTCARWSCMGYCRHDKAIQGDDVLDMVLKEGLPRWRWWLGWPPPVFLHRRRGHLDAQLVQLADDPRRAPGRIRLSHRLDQLADLLCNRGATGVSLLTQAVPVVTKVPLLPGDHRAGLDEC